jgi:shikimate kinase
MHARGGDTDPYTGLENVSGQVPLVPPVTRVVLTGFMGAGKSTVGRLLAPALGWTFFDVDAVLAARERLSVADIFSRHGEAHFRELESSLIEECLQTKAAVIALGGGALEHARTRSLLTQTPHVLLVFLQSSLAISIDRCALEPDAAIRPIMNNRESLAARYTARQPLYAAAHVTLSAEELRPLEIVERITTYVSRLNE